MPTRTYVLGPLFGIISFDRLLCRWWQWHIGTGSLISHFERKCDQSLEYISPYSVIYNNFITKKQV